MLFLAVAVSFLFYLFFKSFTLLTTFHVTLPLSKGQYSDQAQPNLIVSGQILLGVAGHKSSPSGRMGYRVKVFIFKKKLDLGRPDNPDQNVFRTII